MRRAQWLALAISVLALALASHASAERVVLVRPDPSDPVLFDAWNRLAAELRIQHFEVVAVEAIAGDMPGSALAASAEAKQAFAAIALTRRGEPASVDVWLVDRATGKTILRTIVVERGEDAASVLAIRAVDLLRASLLELTAGEPPPKDVAGVDRRAPTPVLTAFSAPPEPRARLRAEALMLFQVHASVAFGPALAASYRLADRFELGLGGAGPLIGGRVDTARGAATLQQAMAFCDARFDVLRVSRFALGVNAALGAYFLRAQGEPDTPLRSRTDGLTAALFALGMHAEVAIVPAVAASVAARAVAIVPRVGVAVGDASSRMGRPALAASAGIRVAL
jgi:hypothetical protein